MADELKNLAITISVEGSAQAKAALDRLSNSFDDTARAAGKSDDKMKSMSQGLTSFGVFAANLAANAVTALARELTQLGISLGSQVINEAAEGEKTFIELAAAVERAGYDVESTTAKLDSFASQLATTTRFTDDEIKSAEALALSLGMSTAQIEEYFTTAADLAVGKGASLKDAVLGISKSLVGAGGPLSRLLPELKEFTEEELRAGKAVEYVRKAFGGAAAAEISTYTGAIVQMKKAWADILETIGGPIIEVLKPAIRDLTTYMQTFVGGEELKSFGKQVADALTEVGAYVLNFYWFMIGKDSYFGRIGWDTEGGVWDRLLETLTQALDAIISVLIEWASSAKVVEAMAGIGISLGVAISKGILKGIWNGIAGDNLKIIGASSDYIMGSLMGGPMSQSWPEYARSQGLKGYEPGPAKQVKPEGSWGDPVDKTNQTTIQQDVKIYTNGESAEALQRQLRTTAAMYKTNVYA